MKFLSKVLLLLAVTVLAGLLAASVIAGYNASVSFLVSTIHEEARVTKIFSLVTENKFLLLQLILFFILSIIIFFLVKFNAIWEITLKFLHQFKKSFVQILGNALRSDTLFIFILPVASYIFFAFYLPVTYDEASTYVNFTSRSPLVSMLYYPF